MKINTFFPLRFTTATIMITEQECRQQPNNDLFV